MTCYIDNRAYIVVFVIFYHIFAVANQHNSQPKK